MGYDCDVTQRNDVYHMIMKRYPPQFFSFFASSVWNAEITFNVLRSCML